MSNAPATKYTERDVRENPDFHGIAYNYLIEYEGEFEFLVDCKMRIANNMTLTPGMIKGVLNCMRVDPRVPDMPPPMDLSEEYADVIPMRERRLPRKSNCAIEGYHTHRFEDFDEINYCPGKFEYMREPYELPAKLKGEFYVVGRSQATVTLHRAMSALFQWHPFKNEAGFYAPPTLIVKTNCKHPYSLRNPYLLTDTDVERYNKQWTHEDDERYLLIKCFRCFDD